VFASLIGRKLGQYTVVAELGRGQHSAVYKAWQPSLERHVALKVLRRHDKGTLRRFESEARLTAQLVEKGVPNIRQVYEVDRTDEGDIFVAMEYVEDSLRSVLRRARKRGMRMNAEASARLLIPVADALDAIHSLGWVHLDIKPQNILISQDGRALLADFGIAHRRGMRTEACTPTYASPEQAAGNRPVGPWSDIYSLGVVLYEMIAGNPPVRGDHEIVLLNQHLEARPPSPRRVNPQLSSSQERVLFKALSKSPKDRYETAGDFIQAMLATEVFLSSVVQTPARMASTTSRWLRHVSRPALLIGILLILLIVTAIVVWLLWPRPPTGALSVPGPPEPGLVLPTVAALSPTPVVRYTRQPTRTVESTATLRTSATLTPSPWATTAGTATLETIPRSKP
jgi:serine/threonine-protein kinase